MPKAHLDLKLVALPVIKLCLSENISQAISQWKIPFHFFFLNSIATFETISGRSESLFGLKFCLTNTAPLSSGKTKAGFWAILLYGPCLYTSWLSLLKTTIVVHDIFCSHLLKEFQVVSRFL